MGKRGFTLIELVMIIVILGVLSAIAVPRYLNMQAEAERAVIDSWVGSLKSAQTLTFSKAILLGNSTYKSPGGLGFSQFLQCDGNEQLSDGGAWGIGNVIGLAPLRKSVFKDPNQDAVEFGGNGGPETISFDTKSGKNVVITRSSYDSNSGSGGAITWQAK